MNGRDAIRAMQAALRVRVLRKNLTPIERIEQDVQFEQNTGCWLWSGPTSGKYGCIGLLSKSIYAHRYAYHHLVAPIPEGMVICHRCDTPLCVSPNHLFAGTQSDNIIDAVRKGRFRPPVHRGAANYNTKLTPDQVRSIRRDKRATAAIAAEYGVAVYTIFSIRKGLTWKHVA